MPSTCRSRRRWPTSSRGPPERELSSEHRSRGRSSTRGSGLVRRPHRGANARTGSLASGRTMALLWGSSGQLLGRDPELAAIEGLLDGGRRAPHSWRGRRRQVVLAGRCGSTSDTSLASGVLSATGVEAEAELPFAGLHQALLPVVDGRRRTARPATEGAPDGVRPRRRGAAGPVPRGLATLSLLTDLAANAGRPARRRRAVARRPDRRRPDVRGSSAWRRSLWRFIAAVREGLPSPLLRGGLRELRLRTARGLRGPGAARSPRSGPAIPGSVSGSSRRQPAIRWRWSSSRTRCPRTSATVLRRCLPMLRLSEHLEHGVRGTHLPGCRTTTRRLLLVATANESEAIDEIVAAASTIVEGSTEVRPRPCDRCTTRQCEWRRSSRSATRSCDRPCTTPATNLERRTAHTALAMVLDHLAATEGVAPRRSQPSAADEAVAARAGRRRGCVRVPEAPIRSRSLRSSVPPG